MRFVARLLRGVNRCAPRPGGSHRQSAQPKPAPAVLRVAYIPIANYTALLVARDKGYFAEEKPVGYLVAGGARGGGGRGGLRRQCRDRRQRHLRDHGGARQRARSPCFLAGATHIRSEPPDNNALLVRTEDAISRTGRPSSARGFPPA